MVESIIVRFAIFDFISSFLQDRNEMLIIEKMENFDKLKSEDETIIYEA